MNLRWEANDVYDLENQIIEGKCSYQDALFIFSKKGATTKMAKDYNYTSDTKITNERFFIDTIKSLMNDRIKVLNDYEVQLAVNKRHGYDSTGIMIYDKIDYYPELKK